MCVCACVCVLVRLSGSKGFLPFPLLQSTRMFQLAAADANVSPFFSFTSKQTGVQYTD